MVGVGGPWAIIYMAKLASLNMMASLIMPRCACASEVYGSVFVCVCVCVCRVLQLLNDNYIK